MQDGHRNRKLAGRMFLIGLMFGFVLCLPCWIIEKLNRRNEDGRS